MNHLFTLQFFPPLIHEDNDTEKRSSPAFITEEHDPNKPLVHEIDLATSRGNTLLKDAYDEADNGNSPLDQKRARGGRGGGGESRQVTLESAALELRKKRRHRWGSSAIFVG